MDRIINVKVGGNYISKDSKNAGVTNEGNITKLRITFDEGWDGYSKTVTFWDARGGNPVKRVETMDLLEDIETRTYITPIPPEAMAIEGELTFVIDGYKDGVRQRTIADTLVVKYSPYTENASEPTGPTPEPYEQVQKEVESIKDDVQYVKSTIDRANEYMDLAKDCAKEAEESAEKAEKAVGKTSYIGDNGHWYAWDAESESFQDTGIMAQAGSMVYVGYKPPDEADVWITPYELTTPKDIVHLDMGWGSTSVEPANKVDWGTYALPPHAKLADAIGEITGVYYVTWRVDSDIKYSGIAVYDDSDEWQRITLYTNGEGFIASATYDWKPIYDLRKYYTKDEMDETMNDIKQTHNSDYLTLEGQLFQYMNFVDLGKLETDLPTFDNLVNAIGGLGYYESDFCGVYHLLWKNMYSEEVEVIKHGILIGTLKDTAFFRLTLYVDGEIYYLNEEVNTNWEKISASKSDVDEVTNRVNGLENEVSRLDNYATGRMDNIENDFNSTTRSMTELIETMGIDVNDHTQRLDNVAADLTDKADLISFNELQDRVSMCEMDIVGVSDNIGMMSTDIDSRIGNIETALDSIIEIQNTLIGGDS